jgi:hypothetical protein
LGWRIDLPGRFGSGVVDHFACEFDERSGRRAAKALGKTASRDITHAKKRVLSAKGRAKISKAMKERWAKVRAQATKAAA